MAAEKGNTYFVFDRGKTAKITECCRLSLQAREADLGDAKTPWKMRYSALQNVTLNLPRAAYEANRNDDEAVRAAASATWNSRSRRTSRRRRSSRSCSRSRTTGRSRC